MKLFSVLAGSAILFAAPIAAFDGQKHNDGNASVTEASKAHANEADKASEEKSKADQKIKCRRLTVTGSLVKRKKICRTVAEWKEISQAGNRSARTIVDHANQGSTSGR